MYNSVNKFIIYNIKIAKGGIIMIVEDIDITDTISLQLNMEDDEFVIKLYEISKECGYKEQIVYRCDRADTSLDEMIHHTRGAYNYIINNAKNNK